jgi:hypothetical protein
MDDYDEDGFCTGCGRRICMCVQDNDEEMNRDLEEYERTIYFEDRRYNISDLY